MPVSPAPSMSTVYYFSHFNILNIIARRCVFKRIYLHSNIKGVLGEGMAGVGRLASVSRIKNQIAGQPQPSDNISADTLATLLADLWIEDQLLYDITNYKNRMLSCSATEFYQPANTTIFRIRDFQENILSRIDTDANSQDLFEEVTSIFFSRMSELWIDISLSDYIMTVAKSPQHLPEGCSFHNSTTRHFTPLMKLTSTVETRPRKVNKRAGASSQEEKVSKVARESVSPDDINFSAFSQFFASMDDLISANANTQVFQYVDGFAVYILELDNEYLGAVTCCTSKGQGEAPVAIRIIQPASVFYEILVNTFLMLAMIDRATLPEFTRKTQRFFSNLWSAGMATATDRIFDIFSQAWKEAQLSTCNSPYHLSRLFIYEARRLMLAQWEKDIAHRFSSTRGPNRCRPARLSLPSTMPCLT